MELPELLFPAMAGEPQRPHHVSEDKISTGDKFWWSLPDVDKTQEIVTGWDIQLQPIQLQLKGQGATCQGWKMFHMGKGELYKTISLHITGLHLKMKKKTQTKQEWKPW